MTIYTIEYRCSLHDGNLHDDWDYSVLNDDEGFVTLADAIMGMFDNAKNLVERLHNIPNNDYRIVDQQGIEKVFYSRNQFVKTLQDYIDKTTNQFEIET